MYNVYSQAEQVLIWLGLETEKPTYAFETLEKALESISDGISNSGKSRNYKGIPHSQEDMEAIVELFAHRYWSWVWICQVVYLAQDLKLLYGHFTLDHSEKQGEFCWHFYSNLSKIEGAADAVELAWDVLGRRQERIGADFDRRPDLVEMLYECRRRSCHDPRDKVFGMIACLEPFARVPINYGFTPWQVYSSVVKAIIPWIGISGETTWPLITLRAELGLEPYNAEEKEELRRDWEAIQMGAIGLPIGPGQRALTWYEQVMRQQTESGA